MSLQPKAEFIEKLLNEADLIDDNLLQVLAKALSEIPRELFVESNSVSQINNDIPLKYDDLNYGVTPSKIVRVMSLMSIKKKTRILQIGAESGYSSALMAATGADIFLVDKTPSHTQNVRKKADSLNLQNIIIKMVNVDTGWKDAAPFEVIVSFDLIDINKELISQLEEKGGKIICPVKNQDGQFLTLNVRLGDQLKSYKLEEWN